MSRSGPTIARASRTGKSACPKCTPSASAKSGQVGAVVDDRRSRRVTSRLAQDSGACRQLAVAEGLLQQLQDVFPSFHEDLRESSQSADG